MNYQAVSLALRITEDYNPDVRITGSDGVDFYSLSCFDKNPERINSLQLELDSWAATQRSWLDAAPNARNYFLIGNHEDRLRKWLWKHPELYSLKCLTLENLFEFEKLKIEPEPRQELVFHNRLTITHGSIVRKYSGYSAKAELEKIRYQTSIMTGHTHRGGRYFTTTPGGIVEALECFCLCLLAPEYSFRPDWQQGLCLVEVTEDYVSFDMIPFHQVKGELVAHWRGKEYKP